MRVAAYPQHLVERPIALGGALVVEFVVAPGRVGQWLWVGTGPRIRLGTATARAGRGRKPTGQRAGLGAFR